MAIVPIDINKNIFLWVAISHRDIPLSGKMQTNWEVLLTNREVLRALLGLLLPRPCLEEKRV